MSATLCALGAAAIAIVCIANFHMPAYVAASLVVFGLAVGLVLDDLLPKTRKAAK
jgi:hypothetical protein